MHGGVSKVRETVQTVDFVFGALFMNIRYKCLNEKKGSTDNKRRSESEVNLREDKKVSVRLKFFC